MRLKQILLLALIVSWLRPTDRPTDRQCHLLSCPGQLKRNTLPTISNMKDTFTPKIVNVMRNTCSICPGERYLYPKNCECNKKHLQHLSRRRGGARFKVFCNFKAGIRRQQPRRHLLGKIHFFTEIILQDIFRIFEFLKFRQGMSISEESVF